MSKRSNFHILYLFLYEIFVFNKYWFQEIPFRISTLHSTINRLLSPLWHRIVLYSGDYNQTFNNTGMAFVHSVIKWQHDKTGQWRLVLTKQIHDTEMHISRNRISTDIKKKYWGISKQGKFSLIWNTAVWGRWTKSLWSSLQGGQKSPETNLQRDKG